MSDIRNRRAFLQFSAATLSSLPTLLADDRPAIQQPRATDGDTVHEPDWDSRLTLRVGNQSGDLSGKDDRVIQAAIDYVARGGGGTVELQAGVFTLRNSIYLPSGIRLTGQGADTLLTRGPSTSVLLAADSDWYDQEITLKESGPLQVGDGVTLLAKNPHNGSQVVIKRTLVAQSGRRFKLNDGLRENLWLTGEPRCTSLFPLLTSERTSDVVIENLTLDGNKDNCENLNGNYGGCIFLQDCNRYKISNVIARNFNGDGISFQICHDVQVLDCHSHDNTNLGIHPGSGSQRPLIRGCTMNNNDQGLFWCWGVKFGLAEGNQLDANRSYGMSIGHNDTDNVIRRNRITNSGRIGILFRDDPRGQDFWANRNLVADNVISNSGAADGVGIDVTGKTKDARITGNQISENRPPMQRVGIRIGNDVGAVKLEDNTINGYQTAVLDNRRSAVEPA